MDDVWQGGSCRRSRELRDRLLHHRGPRLGYGRWASLPGSGPRSGDRRDDLDCDAIAAIDECF